MQICFVTFRGHERADGWRMSRLWSRDRQRPCFTENWETFRQIRGSTLDFAHPSVP